MKKYIKKVLWLLVFLIPFLLIGQESINAMQTVNTNSNFVSQLAQLLPMGINPYATVFLTSILSKSGIHNEFVGTNPFFDNWMVVGLFGVLFIFTALVGTVFKTNKATAVVGLADNYLSNHAAILINIVVILAPSFFGSSNESEALQQAGILSIGLKTIVVLIVSVYFLIVVTTVRFFIDILIFLTPIPFIDSILEIIKIIITVLFVGISIFFPTFSVILSVIMFLVALSLYRKSSRLVSRTIYLFMKPIIHMFKSREKILFKKDVFSISVYLNIKTNRFKKGTIVQLEEKGDGFYLVKHKFFLSKVEEKINLTNCDMSKGSLKSTITNEEESISLFLNRLHHTYIEEITEKLNLKVKGKDEPLIISMDTEKGLLSKVKSMFNKEDVEELKLY